MKSLRLLLRFLTVGGLVLLLLIPLVMVRGIISDRERYQAQAIERIGQSTAGAQQVIGPLRVVPWEEVRSRTRVDAEGKPEIHQETVRGYLLQTPRTLQVSGGLKPNLRRIGLYEVRTYDWSGKLVAAFEPLVLEASAHRVYGRPLLVMGISDVRGLIGTPSLNVDGRALAFQAGTGALSERMSGVHAVLGEPGAALPASRMQLDLMLTGTESLGISPVADSNRIDLHSAWPHPLFGGRFSPNQRVVDDHGFRASWEISALANDTQAQLERGEGLLTRRQPLTERAGSIDGGIEGVALTGIDSIDVHLVDTVDVYTQADRATKYGILFVVLTFVGFALFELIKRLPIHPLQYLLVGLALAIFFLLLLSLSEHIAFWQAYLISATACIGLQFFYLSGVLRSWVRAAGFATTLTALYGVLYALLLSEANALLMGSLLLFGILAAIMWLTRKVDWYELGSTPAQDAPAPRNAPPPMPQ